MPEHGSKNNQFYYIVFIVKSGSKFIRYILCNNFHLLINALWAES